MSPPRHLHGAKGARRAHPGEGLGGEQVEGRRAVRELLAARRRQAREVWMAAGLDRSPLLDEIVELAGASGVPLREVSAKQLETRAVTGSHQGVLARAEPLRPVPLAALCRSGETVTPLLVVADGVTDPRNLGAMIRGADFAGATGFVLARQRAVMVTPTVAKTAAGAIEHLPVAVVAGIPSALAELSRRRVWTVGLDPEAEDSIYDLAVADQPLALVLGSEGRGIGRLVRSRCDSLVSIPSAGRTASLNVAVACGVACLEVARRRVLS